jgi:hypothetical protein
MSRASPLAQALAVAVLLGGGSAQAASVAPPRPPRTAIVVGATAPATGRAALRDAEAIRDALVSVGDFEAGRVHVLRDPEPEALLALVTREAAALAGVPQGLLFFYFSGHADGGALYSAGKAVPVEALRAALDRPEVSLAVDQDTGPIELVHLGTGVRLLELPAGRGQVTVAVPPGDYLVRTVGASGVLAREVEVPPTGSANVSELDLVLVASERLVVKGVEAQGMPSGWPAAGGGEFGVGAETWRETDFQYWSVGTGDRFGAGAGVRFDGRYGITDRLAWKIGTAALAYRLGERGGVEVAPYAGLLGWQAPLQRAFERQYSWDHRGAGEVRLGGGVGVRAPSSVGAMVVTLGFDRTRIDEVWASRFGGAVGLSLAFGQALTFHVAAAYLQHDEPASRGAEVFLGSVQDFGLESLPLVRISPWGTWALDLFASGGSNTRVSYRLGVSRRF